MEKDMFYILTLIPVVMLSIAIVRYWRSLQRLGHVKEVISHAPNMLALDGVSLLLAALTAYWSLHSWFGITLPILQRGPMAEWQVTFMAVVSCIASCAIAYVNAGERFTHPTVAGMREAALRTLAAHRVIDAIELAQLLEFDHARQVRRVREGRIIDINEVRK
jgi:hypothetical protein